MNKRIKELYEQSFLTDDYVNVGINGVELGIKFDPEKFAELIVKECMRMCDCAEASLLEHSYPRESDGAASVKIFIKEHFGVEE
jgi:hypothetical protein